MYATTLNRKGTCSATSALAEASHSSPTSLRYYTPEVHPPALIRNFLEDAMQGNMRCDIAPPPPSRRLTTKHHKAQPPTSDHDLLGHWMGSAIFGLTWVAI
eukprot:2544195-Pyramimonas_sp.AAC.1